MLELVAVLPPEDGAVVIAAMDKVHLDSPPPGTVQADLDPAEDPWAARRADELVEVANQWLSGTAASPGGEPAALTSTPRRLVVHVDLSALTSGSNDGVCRVDDGPTLPAAVARRIGCDTELVAIAERHGVPIDVGRSRRTISSRQRLALQARDCTCRFPGCGVPANLTEGHHIRHWADGGPTDLDNLLSLCRFHHHRLHDGVFQTVVEPGGGLRFQKANGAPIGPHPGRVARNAVPPPAPHSDYVSPRALGGGPSCDFGYVIEVLTAASLDAISTIAGASATVGAGPAP
jgi:hypothetical protein